MGGCRVDDWMIGMEEEQKEVMWMHIHVMLYVGCPTDTMTCSCLTVCIIYISWHRAGGSCVLYIMYWTSHYTL